MRLKPYETAKTICYRIIRKSNNFFEPKQSVQTLNIFIRLFFLVSVFHFK